MHEMGTMHSTTVSHSNIEKPSPPDDSVDQQACPDAGSIDAESGQLRKEKARLHWRVNLTEISTDIESSSGPFHRIPVEIMAVIFEWLMLERDRKWDELFGTPYGPIPTVSDALTAVSKGWRNVAISIPTLWQNIVVSSDSSPNNMVTWSRTIPLNVMIYPQPNESALSAVMAQSNRWKSVEFVELDADMYEVLKDHAGLFQRLETLCIGDRGDWEEDMPNIYAFQIAPCLEMLILRSFGNIVLPWTQLTTLHLWYIHAEGCHSALSLCPNLEECKIWFPEEEILSISPPIIELPHLLRFRVDLPIDSEYYELHFLSVLSLAKLQHLEMSDFDLWPHESVLSIMQQSRDTLTLLRLDACAVVMDKLLELLRPLPSLRTLVLHMYHCGESGFQDLMEGLTPLEGADTVILPRLSSFDMLVSGFAIDDELAKLFQGMVRSRWSCKRLDPGETRKWTHLGSSKFAMISGVDEGACSLLHELRDEGYDITIRY